MVIDIVQIDVRDIGSGVIKISGAGSWFFSNRCLAWSWPTKVKTLPVMKSSVLRKLWILKSRYAHDPPRALIFNSVSPFLVSLLLWATDSLQYASLVSLSETESFLSGQMGRFRSRIRYLGTPRESAHMRSDYIRFLERKPSLRKSSERRALRKAEEPRWHSEQFPEQG